MRALLLVILIGCTELRDENDPFPPDPLPDGAPDAFPLMPTYASLEANVFHPRCMGVCHSGGDFAAGSFDMFPDPHAAMVDVPAMGTMCAPTGLVRVAPGMPEASLLFLKLRAKRDGTAPPCGDPMPQGNDRPAVTQEELDAIEQWILGGAAR